MAVAAETACVAASVILKCFEDNDFSQDRLEQIQALREKDVLRVHGFQHRAGKTLVGASGVLRRLVYVAIRLLSLSGLVPVLARQMLTQRRPLPIEGVRNSGMR